MSMSRNSASSLMALSERMSMDFMREITKVTKNCASALGSTDKMIRGKYAPLHRHLARRAARAAGRQSFD